MPTSPPDEFQKRTVGARIEECGIEGNGLLLLSTTVKISLLSLGMGADILYFDNEENEADKYQVKVIFSDGSGYTARFWWFGKFLLVSDEELASESNTKDIAIDPFDEKIYP